MTKEELEHLNHLIRLNEENDGIEEYFEQVSKEYDENEKHLDDVFELGKEQGLDPYCKPASKWLMKKKWCYNKEERKAYNMGYKYGNKLNDKTHFE